MVNYNCIHNFCLFFAVVIIQLKIGNLQANLNFRKFVGPTWTTSIQSKNQFVNHRNRWISQNCRWNNGTTPTAAEPATSNSHDHHKSVPRFTCFAHYFDYRISCRHSLANSHHISILETSHTKRHGTFAGTRIRLVKSINYSAIFLNIEPTFSLIFFKLSSAFVLEIMKLQFFPKIYRK